MSNLFSFYFVLIINLNIADGIFVQINSTKRKRLSFES